MTDRLKPFLYAAIGAFVGVAAFAGFAFKKNIPAESTVDVKEDGRLQYKWYAPILPSEMSFAGESVPLDRDDIKEQLDHEMLVNYYSHSGTLYILKLASRYFSAIEERLKANGVPDDFKYLCVAESSLQNQTSRAGAVGFWQFMKDTGPRYGLEINDEVDERYHVLKATDAACKYFKEAYAKFGTWTAAAASYNCGQGGFSTQATYQQTNYYYNMLLPDETMRYVFRILALKHIISHAKAYGYILEPDEMYKPYKARVVTISNTIPDLATYAIAQGLTYRELKWYNPWLRGHTLTIKGGKTYDLYLPIHSGK